MVSENKTDVLIKRGSIIVSFLIHLMIVAVYLFIKVSGDSDFSQPGYTVISSMQDASSSVHGTNFSNQTFGGNARTIKRTADDISAKKDVNLNKELSGKMSSNGNGDNSGFSNIETTGFDSTNLSQIYKEPTLKVEMKYPVGWVYVDQQRKSKLDGITFWASDESYNPPPYIHVEVVEKYLFNQSKYKYNYKFKNFDGYYNDPEEMEGQVSQQIYIRTKDDEDFIIKLIINGKENFNRFQPVFFAIINSFRFGNSLFF